MATEAERLVFNGVHGDTGGYLLPPMSPEELTPCSGGSSPIVTRQAAATPNPAEPEPNK